jgi:hypothetical protein
MMSMLVMIASMIEGALRRSVGAERAAHRHGDRVDQPAVHQQHAVTLDRGEKPGHRDRGAYRLEQRPLAQPDFATGGEVGRHHAAGHRERREIPVLDVRGE